MKIAKVFLICLCCVIAVPALWGQTTKAPAKSGILGYLDPYSGAFRPVPPAAEESDPAALTTFTGTITVTLTITVKTPGLTNISCQATTSVLDNAETSPRNINENANATATGSGNTRTCKVTIPYAWGLATQSSDSMTISYFVNGNTGTLGGIERSSNLFPLDTRKVPASGATTALTAAVTL
jgi:hypothetical protein